MSIDVRIIFGLSGFLSRLPRFSFTEITGFADLVRKNKFIQLEEGDLFEDLPNTQQPFKSHYQQYILPHVKEFEEKRIEALKELRRRALITIPAIIGSLLILIIFRFTFLANIEQILSFFWALVGIGLIWWTIDPATSYKSSVKSVIFPNVFSFFGSDYKYTETSIISVNSLKSSDIIPNYDREHTEDYVRGSYQDVRIELVEARMTETNGSGKTRRTVTVFDGIFILFEMNKNFSGKTIVKKDVGAIGNWLTEKLGRLENVKLEDPVFEKKFEIYSNDQVESRYLLTTSFMERLLRLSELFGNSKLQCSFYDNKLLLMIPSNENRFETSSIFEPATFVEDSKTILAQMKEIFGIIETLKLNQRIGL